MTEPNVEEELKVVDLLKKDIGKTAEQLYEEIGSIVVRIEERPIRDTKYFIQKITETRRAIDRIQTIFGSLLRAKTIAQSRLTSLETRYEILMNSKLGDDPTVRAGTSIEDRKARAANTMIGIKREIREAKNEVEAIKNLREVANMVMKNFTGLNSDIKQQSKLVEVEFKYMQVTPQGSDQDIDLFGERLQGIIDRNRLNVQSVESVGDEDEESCINSEDEELEEPGVLETTDTSVENTTELGQDDIGEESSAEEPLETLPTEIEEYVSDSGSMELEITVALDLPYDSDVEEESSGFTLDLPEESLSLSVPDEESSSFSVPDDQPSEVNVQTTAVPAPIEAPEGLEEESNDSSEDYSDDIQFPASSSDQDLLIDDTELNLPALSLDGFGMPEVVPDAPVKELPNLSNVIVTVVAEAPEAPVLMVPNDFQVESVVANDPKISKHFVEETEELKAKAVAKLEVTGTIVQPAKKPVNIDDVLSMLGV